MKIDQNQLGSYGLALFVAASLVSACSSTPGATGLRTSLPTTKHAAIVTTAVKVFNNANFPLLGSLPSPAPCWTVSPSPLPGLGNGGGHTPKITLSRDTSCFTSSVTMTYGGNPSFSCTFNVAYHNSTGMFTYTPGGTPEMACTVAPAPPSSNYDEQLIVATNPSCCRSSRRGELKGQRKYWASFRR